MPHRKSPAGSSAVKRILFGKQLLLDKAHRAAAKHDHYIFVLEILIPEGLKYRGYACVALAHIRKLVNDEQPFAVAITQLGNTFQSRFPVGKFFDVACSGDILPKQLLRKAAQLQFIRDLTAGVENVRLPFAEFTESFGLADTPSPVKHNELTALAVVFIFQKLQFLFSSNKHIITYRYI